MFGTTRRAMASDSACLLVLLLSAALLAHHLLELFHPLFQGIAQGSAFGDFRIYLCGGRHLATAYDSCTQPEAVSGFVYPPPSILLMAALGMLNDDTAFRLQTLCSIVLLAIAAWMLIRLEKPGRPALVLGAAMAGALAISPIGNSLYAGQVNIMIMAACVIGTWAAGQRRWGLAGASIALGFWLKLYPIVILGLFFVNRVKRPALIAALAIVALIAGVSLIWIPADFFTRYFGDLVPRLQAWTQPGIAYSIAGLVTHIQSGGGAPIYHFVPIPEAAKMVSIAVLLAGCALAAFHEFATRDDRPAESLGILLAAVLVTSPSAWNFHYALAMPLVFVSMARAMETGWSFSTLIVLACWLAFAIPGWTLLPPVLAGIPAINIAFHARYEAAAAIMAGLIFWSRRECWADGIARLRQLLRRAARHPHRDAQFRRITNRHRRTGRYATSV